MKSHAKKRFGQHFLTDTGILERTLRVIRPGGEDIFLEVGAGYGALSLRLAPHVARLFAVELDRDCLPGLQASLAQYPHASVIGEDILQLDIVGLVSPFLKQGRGLRIVGNLPYNIATVIIDRSLTLPLPVDDMTFMVQLEVVQRMVARPGTRQYGYFSVFCQHLTDMRFEFRVPPACFVPRPKVTSALVTLRSHRWTNTEAFAESFVEITKAAFSHRRKTLANSLRQNRNLGAVADELLAFAKIDPIRRPEQLTVKEYESLAEIYEKHFKTLEDNGRIL